MRVELPLAALFICLSALCALIARLATPPWPRRHRGPLRTMVVLGSGASAARRWALPVLTQALGGHTAEMFALLGAMQLQQYSPRVYVVAATDRRGAVVALCSALS